MTTVPAPGGATRLLDHLLEAHLQAASGVLEYETAGRLRRLPLALGELYLVADSALAPAARELAASSDLSRWEAVLARVLQAYVEVPDARSIALRRDASLPPGAVGPLPTEALLRRGYAALAAGGEWTDATLVAAEAAPGGSDGLLAMSPEENWVLERLSRPMRIDALARECPFPGERLHGVVAGLRAVGRVHDPGRAPLVRQGSGLHRLFDLLSARIGASLRERPLGLLDDALARSLGELLRNAAAMNHYQLLGVAPDAGADEIQDAFDKLARRVHPVHAERPAVGHSRAALTGLFERAVAAFRTLSDPAMRAAYDAVHEVERPAAGPEAGERREEVAELARREFDRARFEELNGDLHSALVLYEQVVELHPRAEYFLTLARLQARNAAWSERALESCRRALELDPESVEGRFLAGELHERIGQLERAAHLYRAVVRSRPAHGEAQAALRRLAARGVRDEPPEGGGLGRLFRRG